MQQFSSEDLKARRARGESKTDLARLRSLPEEQLERDIAADPDFRDVPANWYEAAEAVMPEPKRLLSLRIDANVVDYFRSLGPGYQTRINAVLRSFVQQQQDKRTGR